MVKTEQIPAMRHTHTTLRTLHSYPWHQGHLRWIIDRGDIVFRFRPAGRLHIGTINREFLNAGGSVAEYGAAVKAAIDRGYIDLHASGAYLSFTQAGAELFA
jgi:hypothetical protein